MCKFRHALLATACSLFIFVLPPYGAAADPGSLYQGPEPRPGPDILYAKPAWAPQLTNAGVWEAEPILISGASAYRQGEFVYQDFLYDDPGAAGRYTYPTHPAYARNAADLVELRIRPLHTATAIRLTYNTLIEPKLTATTIALGSSPKPVPVPHGANARMPAQAFVTVHGWDAEVVDAATGAELNATPRVTVDRKRRQVSVRVPYRVFDTQGQTVRVAAARGSGIGPPTGTCCHARARPRQGARRRHGREPDCVLQCRVPLRRAAQRVVAQQPSVCCARDR
jgi:hypothetical protein